MIITYNAKFANATVWRSNGNSLDIKIFPPKYICKVDKFSTISEICKLIIYELPLIIAEKLPVDYCSIFFFLFNQLVYGNCHILISLGVY